MLQMPSNLLAHHVDVLRDAGLVERRPSEGDRRRSYLRLVPAALDGSPSRLDAAQRGCCSSAQPIPRAPTWRSPSGGVRAPFRRPPPAPTPPTESTPGRSSAAERHHCPSRHQRPRAVDHVRAEGDLVITVCDRAHEEVGGTCTGRCPTRSRSAPMPRSTARWMSWTGASETWPSDLSRPEGGLR